LKKLIDELVFFINPLIQAGDSEESLSAFLKLFGLDIPASSMSSLSNLGGFQAAASDIQNAISNLDINDASSYAAVGTSATNLYGQLSPLINAIKNNLSSLAQGNFNANINTFASELLEDVLNYLIWSYLNQRAPALGPILSALGAQSQLFIAADNAVGRGIGYVRFRYNWAKIGEFVTDNETWSRTTYGWGTSFDHSKALRSIGTIVNQFGARTRYMSLEAIDTSIAQNPVDDSIKLQLPLFQQGTTPDATGGLSAFAETGFVALPSGDMTQLNTLGIAFAPYLTGSVDEQAQITDNLKYIFTLDGDAVGGAYLTLMPGVGLDVVTGGAVNLTFSNRLEYSEADNRPIMILGDEDATRLQISSASFAAGGDLAGDFFIVAGAKDISFIINPGSDGLLSSVLSAEMTLSLGDIALGWRSGLGVYFEGGSNLGIIIPVDMNLGPVNIYEFGVNFDFPEAKLKLTTTLDLTLGPLYAYADGIGMELQFVERQGGILGNRDIEVGFVPPTGYAISLNAPPIEGGGLLDRTDTGYRGALALKFQTIGFSAFGILDTELPAGEAGFSFAASIFAEFSIPLPFGFFLTGLGGIIGINRTVDTDALRSVLYEGRLDNLLFPADPIQNAATILDDMASIFPAEPGQHLFGPVARIAWGQPALINVKLGLVLEVGENIRIVILGGLGTKLPTEDTALVELNITFFGEIDFGARTISFDATLLNSRILTFTVSGDVAVRTGWADRIEHIVSFGGLHPQFPKPSNLPDLRRITINFGSNNPRVTITAYTAITSNSLQFGGRAELYAKGPKIWLIGQLAAEGYIFLDALIYFNPFEFDVALGGGLSLLRNGKVVIGLGFSLRLKGPNTYYINGKVWVKVFGKKIKFSVTHRWGTPQTIEYDAVDLATVLREALENISGPEPVSAAQRVTRVSFLSEQGSETRIAPLGGLQFSQNQMPLGTALQKFGKLNLPPSNNSVDIEVRNTAGQVIPTEPVYADFVRGHFYNLSESERLRATAFERQKSGYSFTEQALVTAANKAEHTQYDYEYIEIPVITAPDEPAIFGSLAQNSIATQALLARFSRSNLNVAIRTREIIEDARIRAEHINVSRPTFIGEPNFAAAVQVVNDNSTNALGNENIAITGVDVNVRAELAMTSEVSSNIADARQRVADKTITLNSNPVLQDYLVAAGRI